MVTCRKPAARRAGAGPSRARHPAWSAPRIRPAADPPRQDLGHDAEANLTQAIGEERRHAPSGWHVAVQRCAARPMGLGFSAWRPRSKNSSCSDYLPISEVKAGDPADGRSGGGGAFALGRAQQMGRRHGPALERGQSADARAMSRILAPENGRRASRSDSGLDPRIGGKDAPPVSVRCACREAGTPPRSRHAGGWTTRIDDLTILVRRRVPAHRWPVARSHRR